MTGVLCAIAGSGGVTVTFPLPATTSVFVIDTAPQSCSYQLQTDGDVSKFENGVETVLGQWISPNTTAADYEVKATLNSGSVSSGTTGTYVSLASNQTWSVSANSPFTSQGANLTIEIRLAAGPGPVVATATVDLYAEYA